MYLSFKKVLIFWKETPKKLWHNFLHLYHNELSKGRGKQWCFSTGAKFPFVCQIGIFAKLWNSRSQGDQSRIPRKLGNKIYLMLDIYQNAHQYVQSKEKSEMLSLMFNLIRWFCSSSRTKTKAALNSIATSSSIHWRQKFQEERDASWVGIMHPLKYQLEFYIMWLVH